MDAMLARARAAVEHADAALLDLDGTLVDTNYQHTLAWFRALQEHGIALPVWRIHRHIGMGGDQLVPALAGDSVEDRLGDVLRETQARQFELLRDECRPLAGVAELLDRLRAGGLSVVLASSASESNLDHFLDLLDVRERVDGWTTADDVERSKPHPDIIHAALEKVQTASAVMVGDSRWDIEAAERAGVPTLCVLTGGWSEQELLDTGAIAVFSSLSELARVWED